MARNKNSTALFEVIHAAKKPPKSSPNVDIPSPKWWAKGKKQEKPPAVQAVQRPVEAVGRQKSWLSAARKNAATSVPPTPEPSYQLPTFDSTAPVENLEPTTRSDWDPTAGATLEGVTEAVTEAAPAPKKRFIDRFTDRPAKPHAPEVVVIPASEPVSITPDIQITRISDPDPDYQPDYQPDDEPQPRRTKPRRGELAAIDRSAHEIKFRLSYGGMIAAVAILVMSLAIAYLAGRRFAGDSVDPQASTKEETTPPSGLMMGVESPKPAVSTTPPTPAPRPEVLQVPTHPARTAVAPAAISTKVTRQIGSTYVVAQCYPETEYETAKSACDYLNRAGIPCTVVKSLDGFTVREWFSVVGTQPFNKHDPDLLEYERRITALGQNFSTKSYNQFLPKLYTWHVGSEQ